MPGDFEVIEGSPRTEEAVLEAHKNNPTPPSNGGKWHTVISDNLDDPLSHLESEFREQGIYVSLTREPAQNSTDNPIREGECVRLRYSFYRLSLSEEERERYLTKNPWRDHITSPDNESLMGYEGDLVDKVSSDMEVVVIEDYNTTGLVGNVNMLKGERKQGTSDFKKSTDENTFFWFLRSTGNSLRRTKGRGGSNALGKLTFPLASKVRTFFVVTTREDGSRFLCGQSIVRTHHYRGEDYEGKLFFAEPELIQGNRYGWTPIRDQKLIDEFCSSFNVNRPIDEPGTSIVVLMPVDEITEKKLGYGTLANYFIPILDNQLKVEIKTYEGDLAEFGAKNVRRLLKEKKLDWKEAGVTKRLNSKPNPAWSSLSRMQELERLYDAKEGTGETVVFELGTPPHDTNKAPDSDDSWIRVLPEEKSKKLEEMTEAFNSGKFLKLTGLIPLKSKQGQVTEGPYTLILHKTDVEAAEAHFYRDKISLPLVKKKEHVAQGVSSLFIAEGGEKNPLAAFLRDMEGPAHLRWNKFDKNNKNFFHVSSTNQFITKLGKKLVARMMSSSSDKEAIWNKIFSRGKQEKNIVHYFDIQELEEGGAVVTAPAEGIKDKDGNEIDLRGKEFIARVGYPTPFAQNLKNPPHRNAIDTHAMDWSSKGAEIFFDVEAREGGLCYDRVRIRITDQDFRIELQGTDTELKAQIALNEVVV